MSVLSSKVFGQAFMESCGMVCSAKYSMFPVHLQGQVQCILYTVQCVGYSVLPAKDGNLAVETG